MIKANDYNVLFLFFNNLQRTKQVFEKIKEAKPKNLFLFQDGPRKDRNELEKIIEARAYVESNINWDCTVYKNYQIENLGCDPAEYISQKWAFSIVDKCIILEDDDVPDSTFFEFCWTLLKKYEDNNRIGIICGMNNLDIYDKNGCDYFFTKSGCIWGWATWKRVVDQWDANYSWLDNKNSLVLIKRFFSNRKRYNKFICKAKARRKSGIAYYETILGVACILNNQLNIVPTKNLITNIGITGGTHTGDVAETVPKKTRGLFFKKTYSLSFPLKHPDAIKEDTEYKKMVDKQLELNFFEKVFIKIKTILFSK